MVSAEVTICLLSDQLNVKIRLDLQLIFTALHVMQTRYCDEISVRPSVRPSVRLSVSLSVTRVNCDKTLERSVQIYIPYERTFILVF